MRNLTTLALMIFSMTACAVDTTNEPADIAERAAIDLIEDGTDAAEDGIRCTANDECATGACDIITRSCVPAPDDDEPTPPHRPETDSGTRFDGAQAAPPHIHCNPLVNCYPF